MERAKIKTMLEKSKDFEIWQVFPQNPHWLRSSGVDL